MQAKRKKKNDNGDDDKRRQTLNTYSILANCLLCSVQVITLQTALRKKKFLFAFFCFYAKQKSVTFFLSSSLTLTFGLSMSFCCLQYCDSFFFYYFSSVS